MENQEQNYEAPKNSNEIEDQQIPGDPSETASIDDAGDVDEQDTAKGSESAPKAGGPPTDNDQAVGQDADYSSQESLEKSLTGDTPVQSKTSKATPDDSAEDKDSRTDEEVSGSDEDTDVEDADDTDDVEELEEEGEEVTEGDDSVQDTDTDPGKNANSGIEDISDKDKVEL